MTAVEAFILKFGLVRFLLIGQSRSIFGERGESAGDSIDRFVPKERVIAKDDYSRLKCTQKHVFLFDSVKVNQSNIRPTSKIGFR